jgi:DNA-3-methyladenine glycosylase
MLLPREYYQNNDVVFLAKDLLGKVLLTEIEGILTSGIIVETEAYKAPEDRASHAFNNKITARTKTMYLEGGHSYIYLCYGIHEMCNVVTAKEGLAHAVLIRAIEPLEGLDIMLKRRNHNALKSNITRGPGCVCKALGITGNMNARPFYVQKSPLRIYDQSIRYSSEQLMSSKRIGVDYAGESANWPYRFYVKENTYVSKHPKSG